MITHSSTGARCVWPKCYPARPASSERHDKDDLCLNFESQTKVRQNNIVLMQLMIPQAYKQCLKGTRCWHAP